LKTKTTNEKLTTALTYATNQREYLETFLEDGRLPISNNLCEANIRPYAMQQQDDHGCLQIPPKEPEQTLSCIQLVESARANGLDVHEYLKYLLTEMPNNRHLEQPEILDQYLLWSKELPEECRSGNRN